MDTHNPLTQAGKTQPDDSGEGVLCAAGLDRQILGASDATRTMVSRILKAAPLNQPVLITGEPGTGKSLAARAIHHMSHLSDHPFVALDCLAVPLSRQVKIIFGQARPDGEVEKGLLERAAGGTLFLDEVARLSDDFQARLLQMIRDRVFTPVGASEPVPVRTRIIASSCRVPGVVSAFRLDGMNEVLGIVPIHIPPLRERLSDTPVLFRHFLAQAASRRGLSPPGVTRQANSILERHSWPGNVRELIHAADWIMAVHPQGDISAERLPGWLGAGAGDEGFLLPGKPVDLEELEKNYIKHVLDLTGGGIQKAAKVLGINRKTLSLKLKKYGLSARDTA